MLQFNYQYAALMPDLHQAVSYALVNTVMCVRSVVYLCKDTHTHTLRGEELQDGICFYD